MGKLDAFITAVNALFARRDLFLSIRDDQLVLNLNRLDPKLLPQLPRREFPQLTQNLVSAIENIHSYGLRAGQRLYVDFNAERKVSDRKFKEVQREKHFYASGKTFLKDNNALPYSFVNRILTGDAREILTRLPDNCIDLMFTSPPYNFGLEYARNTDEQHWEQYFRELFDVLTEVIRVLKYGGRLIINIQPLFSDYIPSHHLVSSWLMEQSLIWKGEILWEKHNYNCKYTAWGSWRSPSNPYLKYTWEFIEVFCKGEMRKKGDRKNIDISADEFKDWVVARWSIPPERNMNKWDHPAMFPEALVERVLKLFSYQGDIILDPFNGVGTTCAVASRLDRTFLGIDISNEYCSTARKRIEDTGKKGYG